MRVQYLYFRPARLVEARDFEILDQLTWPEWASETFPWTGPVNVVRFVRSDAFDRIIASVKSPGLPEGAWPADPLQSAPDTVAEVCTTWGLSKAGARLYLQLLCLCDCTEKWLLLVNQWTAGVYRKAADELVTKGLALAEKRPRAGRKHVLAGPWEAMRSPHPAMERQKLALFQAEVTASGVVAAPLGRIVPLEPLGSLFAAGWRTAHDAHDAPAHTTSSSPPSSCPDWLDRIAARPDDDQLRRVYADWLCGRGDPLGELITVQCELVSRQGEDPNTPRLREREQQLIRQHVDEWTPRLQGIASDIRFDRGFVVSLAMRPQDFSTHAEVVAKEAPLVRELVLSAGVRRLTDDNISQLAATELLGQLRVIDCTDYHYMSFKAFKKLISSPYLGRLERLRIGAHAKGGGVGKSGARLIASSPALRALRVLELPGQRLRDDGAKLLAEAELLELERLRLPYNRIGPAGARALVASKNLARLRNLELENHLEVDPWAVRGAENDAAAIDLVSSAT